MINSARTHARAHAHTQKKETKST